MKHYKVDKNLVEFFLGMAYGYMENTPPQRRKQEEEEIFVDIINQLEPQLSLSEINEIKKSSEFGVNLMKNFLKDLIITVKNKN